MSAGAVTTKGSPSLPEGLALIVHQFTFELRGFLRNRQARIFTIMLPVIFLVIFVSLFGNQSVRISRGDVIKTSTYYIPALTSLGIISAAFTNLVISIVTQRENGILKRRRSTPVPAYVLIVGRALVSVVVALFMCALLMGIGAIFYGASVPTHTFPGVIAAAVLGATTFALLAYAVSTLISDADAAQPVIQIILLPLFIISGVFVPSSQIPSWLNTVASIFPVKHLSSALLHAYDPRTTGAGFSGWDLLILGAWAAGSLVVALRGFSWSPRGR